MATGIQHYGFQKYLSQTLFKYNYFIIIYEQFYILYLNSEYLISRKFILVPAEFLICCLFSSLWFQIFLLNIYYLRRGWKYYYSIKRQEILRATYGLLQIVLYK